MAGWSIDSQEFSQVARSNRVDAVITERRECVLCLNQCATSADKQNEEKCALFKKLSGQDEQRCSEPSVVCLGDTEDSQKEKS